MKTKAPKFLKPSVLLFYYPFYKGYPTLYMQVTKLLIILFFCKTKSCKRLTRKNFYAGEDYYRATLLYDIAAP